VKALLFAIALPLPLLLSQNIPADCLTASARPQFTAYALKDKYFSPAMASSNGIRPGAWVILRLASDQTKAVEVTPNT
jgi:hypothetical protein